MSDFINSCSAPEPVGHYPHAKKLGNLLFLSGVGPRKRNSKVIPGVSLSKNGDIISYDIGKQCVSVFENIKLILEEAGSSWDNIVDVTVFLTNMKDDFKIYNKLYKQYFSGPFPTIWNMQIGLFCDFKNFEKAIRTIDKF